MLGFASYAQFSSATQVRDLNPTKGASKATWAQIGTPFTTYDFRDTQHANPISLQAWLDSGFCVIVDYSATWCGPCWNLHQAGILEGYYNAFGPNGTNQVRVIWIEIEETNTADQITGTDLGNTYAGHTYGDWTLGGTVPYPMADDRDALNTCMGLYDNAVPCVFFIAPNGYYRSIYGESDGINSFDVNACNANLSTIIQNYPHANQAPIVNINGPVQVMKGNVANYIADIVSVDQITDISWTFEGGNPASATTSNASTTWNTTGNHTVTLTVSNTTGSATASIDVNVFEWNWGNTMTYGPNINEASAGFRLNSGSTSTWAAMFPAQFMTGRQYLNSVDFYAIGTMNYTLDVYQGGETSPETKIYTRTMKGNGEGWQTMNVSGALPLDQTKNLWISLTAPHAAGYVMSVFVENGDSYYCGDPNGSWASASGQWATMPDMGYEVTWAIRATTGDNPSVGIDNVVNANINLYPNPTTGMVNIEAENFMNATVIDMTGRVVMTTEATTFDISNLTKGVYMVRINTANGTATQKIVKK